MKVYASVDDVINLWRQLSPTEINRTNELIEIVSAALRQEAKNVGRDLDAMIDGGKLEPLVVKAVMVDIIARMLAAPTDEAPVTQTSQSALGYSVSATYLVPGGGLFIKNAELDRLGLLSPRYGGVDFFGVEK